MARTPRSSGPVNEVRCGEVLDIAAVRAVARGAAPVVLAEGAAERIAAERRAANAVGAPLPADTVRAAILLRANGIARGGTGASLAVVELLVAMLNAGVHPVVPRTGSIGAGPTSRSSPCRCSATRISSRRCVLSHRPCSPGSSTDPADGRHRRVPFHGTPHPVRRSVETDPRPAGRRPVRRTRGCIV